MVTKMQKRALLQRKLRLLRTLTNSKSVKKTTILMDALLYIYELKRQVNSIQREYSNLMALKREYLNLIEQLQEVKVEKIGEGLFLVRITCKKREGRLVSVLEAFQKMGLGVLQAKVSCNCFFNMEAIVVAQEQQAWDIRDVTQALVKAIGENAVVNESK